MTSLQTKHRIDWPDIIEEVKTALEWFDEQGIKPTLRTMFYRLVSLETLPNVKSTYKSLSSHTAKARRDNRLPIDCFADEGRVVLGDIPEYQTPEDYVNMGIHFLKRASQEYRVPRWHGQEHYVEVWIEKQALAGTFLRFLGDRQVAVAIDRGYSSVPFLHENCERLKDELQEGKAVHVLYFGDLDPSGADMDRYLTEVFDDYELTTQHNFDFKRMAVTLDQLEQYNLPPKPEDSETLEKLARDTRTRGFIEKYGDLYAIELDALLATNPDRLKKLLQQSVDQYFDEERYQLEVAAHDPELISRLVNDRVTFTEDGA